MGFGDSNHKRLSRSARHLVRSMQRRGTRSQRASALRAHVNALEYAVHVQHKPRTHEPAHPGDREGLRVRLGTETRDLLRRLAASRNYLVQAALVRELRHQVTKRIDAARRRAARAQVARKRGAELAGKAKRLLAPDRSRQPVRASRARTGPAAVPAQAAGPAPKREVIDWKRSRSRRRSLVPRR